jgi:hypothetical protein
LDPSGAASILLDDGSASIAGDESINEGEKTSKQLNNVAGALPQGSLHEAAVA